MLRESTESLSFSCKTPLPKSTDEAPARREEEEDE
jgi:hypothetical protein